MSTKTVLKNCTVEFKVADCKPVPSAPVTTVTVKRQPTEREGGIDHGAQGDFVFTRTFGSGPEHFGKYNLQGLLRELGNFIAGSHGLDLDSGISGEVVVLIRRNR